MRTLAVAGFVATGIGAVIEIALTGLVMPGAIFAAIPLALAILVGLRADRVSLGVAALIAAVFVYGNVAYPVTAQRLQHPDDLGPFVDAALRTLGLAAALVGSTVSALRTRAARDRHATT